MATNPKHNLDAIRAMLANAKKTNSFGSGPQTAFLPERSHKIRFLFDPNGLIYREVVTGYFGKQRFVCPNWAARRDPERVYPQCEGCKLADELKEAGDPQSWRKRCRYNCLVYGYLLETTNPSEYWQPGNVYVIIGGAKLREGLIAFNNSLVDSSPDQLTSMYTPDLPGYATLVNVIPGNAATGKVDIQLFVDRGVLKTIDPIKIDESAYVPLSEVWIDPVFNETSYRLAMQALAESIGEELPNENDENVNDSSHSKNEVIIASSSSGTENKDNKSQTTRSANGIIVPSYEYDDDVPPFPPGVTQADLPENCPGWATNYSPVNPTCLRCSYAIPCVKAQGTRIPKQ